MFDIYLIDFYGSFVLRKKKYYDIFVLKEKILPQGSGKKISRTKAK
jgi:hypothetical protein